MLNGAVSLFWLKFRRCPVDGSCRRGGREMQFVAERRLEQGQLGAAFDATEARFDLEQRRRTPAEFLITGPPACHALRLTFELRHHVFDQVRGLETHAERVKNAQTMQCERFVEAFLQAVRGRDVQDWT